MDIYGSHRALCVVCVVCGCRREVAVALIGDEVIAVCAPCVGEIDVLDVWIEYFPIAA